MTTVDEAALKNAATRAATLWLTAFEAAFAATDAPGNAALEALFQPDSHWRDLVAMSWQVETTSGAAKVASALKRRQSHAGAHGFTLDLTRTPPRHVTRAGSPAIEAFFRFETRQLRAHGLLRLNPVADVNDMHQAWTLFTAADEIKGFEEITGHHRPRGESWSRDFRGPNWLDRRVASVAYEDRDPDVLIVGGGHAGLSIAARLRHLNVDTLIVDREARIGDNWRTRYHALTLHNQVQVNHLPYMPFPASWPTYIPKDKLANWFEAYVESLELNFWTSTTFTGATYDEAAGRWNATVQRAVDGANGGANVGTNAGTSGSTNGSTRILRPRHIVIATSVSGVPNMPEIPLLKSFGGQVMHSSRYSEASDWQGRDEMVIGTGTSGHDIAQDLASNGVRVTLVQRSPTLIVNVEPAAQLPYALYSEGIPTEDCDTIAASMALAVSRQSHRMMAVEAARLDADLIEKLKRAGFKIDEADEYGWQFKFLKRGGGYYFNVGCSELILEGKVGLRQFAGIERFDADGARMRNGDTVRADAVILATGYQGMDGLVRQFFGAAVAERAGPVWGINEDTQELRNMWSPTGQPGLWFIAGSFAQGRIYSKVLALQIKGRLEGLVPQSA